MFANFLVLKCIKSLTTEGYFMKPFYKNLAFFKNFGFFNVGLTLFLIVFDQVIKKVISGSSLPSFGFLGFSLRSEVKNYNFIFGLDFNFNEWIIRILLTAILFLILFYYLVFIFSVFKKFRHLCTGLSFVFAGFSSNLFDRLSNFYVIDYIKWSWIKSWPIYFNLADIFQTIGWIIVIYQVYLFRNQIWKPDEKRRTFVAIKKFQYQFLTYFSLIFFLVSGFFILLSYQFLTAVGNSTFQEFKSFNASFLVFCFFTFVFLYFAVGVFFLYVSNKIYGPIFAFERYIRGLLNKENVEEEFKLRKKDQFKNLEQLAKDIKNHLNKK